MNSEFSVGLSNTISSLFKDDEDYQIVQASEILTYLSNKGFYPPEVIQNVMVEILKSKRSNDPAVVYNIIKVLNSLKDEDYWIESDNWDLIISVFISLNIHLSESNPPSRTNKKQKTTITSSSVVTSSRGVNTVSDSVAKVPFLSSKVLATYFISMYESMNRLGSLEYSNHPLNLLFKVGNRAHILFSEIMSIINNCDHDTLKEMSKFVTLIYRGGKSWEDSILPSISQGFRNIKRCYRRALFCQLMPLGGEKTKLLKGMLEYFYPTGSGNEFVGFSKRKRGVKRELIEELTPWFKKMSTKAIKKCSKTPTTDDQDQDSYYEGQDDDDTNDLNLESPIGEVELFVIMICQLYQTTIITSTQEYELNHQKHLLKLKNQIQNKQKQQKLNNEINAADDEKDEGETEKKSENGEEDDNEDDLLDVPYQVSWPTVYEQFKEFSQTILSASKNNCKNPTLIESNLNGVEIILKFKSTSP
ncbi:hypothetical protein RB653_000289 [Dictyostelium firmibasis]|uniref:Uncharacterized protein n=1 Tax=Dictyostelium firmibasis TaxID=79012 RepID=A0AAN7TV10_9MYCE